MGSIVSFCRLSISMLMFAKCFDQLFFHHKAFSSLTTFSVHNAAINQLTEWTHRDVLQK